MAKHKFASISLTVRDRVISSKLSSNRVSDQYTLGNFPKIFPSPKMAAILNFRIFSKNAKTQNCFYLPCEIERFHRNFRPTGYLSNVLLAVFKKFSPPHIWRPYWIFEFLPKMEKHKFALTVQNRVISLKFSTHGVSKKCTLANFQKIFLFPKMAAIVNFQTFAKNRKTQICFYLLNRAR